VRAGCLRTRRRGRSAQAALIQICRSGVRHNHSRSGNLARVELERSARRPSGMKHVAYLALLVVLFAACSPSEDRTSTRTPNTGDAVSTPLTSIGRVVTTPVTYRSGLMRLDPSDGARPAISASDALAVAGGAQPGDSPEVLLGSLTVFDYGRETSNGLERFVDHRLVWLVVYPHHWLPLRGCHPAPGAQCVRSGRVFIPVDARSGAKIGLWS
jgi:hypothetical protein